MMVARALPAQDPMGLAVGTKAPGAMVQTLDGKRVDLSSFIGKGPVVLEFGKCLAEVFASRRIGHGSLLDSQVTAAFS